MIHLPDPHRMGRVRIAGGEGVQTCPEDHVLGDAAAAGGGELVLGKTAARGEEGAQVPRETSAFEDRRVGTDRGGRFSAQHRNGEGIDEHGRTIDQLVSGAPQRDAPRGAARLSGDHER